MSEFENLKRETEDLKKQVDFLSMSKINGQDIGHYIFNKMLTRLDPVEYCQRVLRSHLPPKKQKLHENQVELIRAVCNPKVRSVAALMARQAGKCFAKDTEILMADGTIKKVQDVQVGDYVMSPQSTPVKVTALGRGKEQMYEVFSLEDGGKYTVNESHILSLLNSNKKIINVTVSDFLNLSKEEQESYFGYRVAVEYPHNPNAKMDSYIHGLWVNQAYPFIHKDYIINSKEVRLGLFAGIIDNSSIEKDFREDGVWFTLPNEDIAKDFHTIVTSLGFRVVKRYGDTYKELKVMGDFSQVPVRVRKDDLDRVGKVDSLSYKFKIFKLLEDEYYGFTIDSEDRLFLLGDYTVTHNTESIASFTGYLLDNYPNMRIGIFTPRIQQAEINLGRTAVFFQMNEDKLNNKLVKCTKQRIELSNGSFAMAVSGSDQSNIEGLTFDIIVLDEAQKITNYTVSERIVPMGGATNAKLVKIGTPKFRNHFWESFQPGVKYDPETNPKGFVQIRRDWTECPQLWALGATYLPDKDTGEQRPYSSYVLNLMPKSLKQQYFPNNPEVWTEGEMSIEDFKTQYMLEFVDGADQFLNSYEYTSLVSGDFDWEQYGNDTDVYYAGIDFAGSSSEGSDYTHISVVRKKPNGVREKVFAMEMHGTNYNTQRMEIIRLFSGIKPRFSVKSIFADYTGCGRPIVDILVHQDGLRQLEGVIFNQSDKYTNSGMNMKNIMFAKIRNEISAGRFKYPSRQNILKENNQSLSAFYYKMVGEWQDLEQEIRMGVNKIIGAPTGGHDDVCCADALANFAVDFGARRAMPKPTTGRLYRNM